METIKTIQVGRYTRKLGVKLELLDHDKLTKVVQNVVRAQYGDDSSWASVEPWSQAIGHLKEPQYTWDDTYDVVMLNTEGVGYEVDDRMRVTVLYNALGSSGWVGVSPRLLLECRSGETIDLAEYVRAFGDRLESNYFLWYTKLKKEA